MHCAHIFALSVFYTCHVLTRCWAVLLDSKSFASPTFVFRFSKSTTTHQLASQLPNRCWRCPSHRCHVEYTRISYSNLWKHMITSSFVAPKQPSYMHNASPTVLRLLFSARDVYYRPSSQAGRPQYAAPEPVTGPRGHAAIGSIVVLRCRLLDGPA